MSKLHTNEAEQSEQPALPPEIHSLFAQLDPQDIEHFYQSYQLWSLQRDILHLQARVQSLQEEIEQNKQRMQSVQPSPIALSTLAQLQACGVSNIDLLERMLARGEDWLDHTLQLLARCEQLDMIRGDYTQWCENALEGAFDWMDSIDEEAPAPKVAATEPFDEATENLLLQKLMSEEETLPRLPTITIPKVQDVPTEQASQNATDAEAQPSLDSPLATVPEEIRGAVPQSASVATVAESTTEQEPLEASQDTPIAAAADTITEEEPLTTLQDVPAATMAQEEGLITPQDAPDTAIAWEEQPTDLQNPPPATEAEAEPLDVPPNAPAAILTEEARVEVPQGSQEANVPAEVQAEISQATASEEVQDEIPQSSPLAIVSEETQDEVPRHTLVDTLTAVAPEEVQDEISQDSPAAVLVEEPLEEISHGSAVVTDWDEETLKLFQAALEAVFAEGTLEEKQSENSAANIATESEQRGLTQIAPESAIPELPTEEEQPEEVPVASVVKDETLTIPQDTSAAEATSEEEFYMTLQSSPATVAEDEQLELTQNTPVTKLEEPGEVAQNASPAVVPTITTEKIPSEPQIVFLQTEEALVEPLLTSPRETQQDQTSANLSSTEQDKAPSSYQAIGNTTDDSMPALATTIETDMPTLTPPNEAVDGSALESSAPEAAEQTGSRLPLSNKQRHSILSRLTHRHRKH